MLDLRLPAGIFFVLLGLILCVVGLFVSVPPPPLADVNVNLYSGLTIFAFGAILLVLAWRSKK